MDNLDEFWHNKAMSSARRWMRHWWAPRTSNPYHSSNISDLTPKTMQTNADKALECRQNADKLHTI